MAVHRGRVNISIGTTGKKKKKKEKKIKKLKNLILTIFIK